jgi:hypothetical protein
VRFFQFRQNNSRGEFKYDNVIGFAEYVIIQAESAADANRRAQSKGIYWGYGLDDCSCCGERWYKQWDEEKGDRYPQIYGTSVKKYKNDSFSLHRTDGPNCYVHFADGRVESYSFAKKKKTKKVKK